jgi:rhamnosyl/mannosyltransferase
MHIVHIYKDYFPVFGGIENLVRVMAESQAKHGHAVDVLVTQIANRKSEIENRNGVRVVKAARQLNIQSAPIAFFFPRHVAQLTHDADIVHLHAPYPIGEACNLFFGRAKKTVITWHSDIVRQKTLLRVYAPILKRVVARADCILSSSEAYAKSSPWINPHLDKVRVVPFGIDPSRFVAAERRSKAAEKIRQSLLSPHRPSSRAPLIVLGLGRLRYYKGFDDLIRAVAQTKDVIGVLVGVGPMEMELKSLAHQLGANDRVIFAGELSDDELPLYYQAADVFALPSNSRAEAFGMVILEAMASGLPILSTEIGTATSWINRHGETGFVVPPQQPNALANAIERLRDDESLCGRMGEAARDRVLNEFTQEKMIERIEEVYRALASNEP